jgi:hypothetical protein
MRPGDVIAERFDLETLVGVGGMGSVVRAHALRGAGRRRADPTSRARFLEAVPENAQTLRLELS